MLCVTRILTPTEIVAWETIVVRPGQPGVSYIPTFVRARKTQGPAFTITGTPQIGVGHSVTGGFTGLNAVGILDQEAEAKWRNGPNVGSDGYPDVSGEDLTVYVGSGVTGDGSEVVVTVGYEEVSSL